MNNVPEAELLALCLQGDTAAWDELFNRHYSPAGRFVFQLSPDFSREDVEEICQESFLTVIRNLNSFKGNSQFQTWLFRIAANKARDYREKQHALKRGGGHQPMSLQAEDPETGLSLDPPSQRPAPDETLLASERHAQVGQALRELGGPCQEIIELRYFGELSYEEISKALELNEKTVSSRLSKCLDKLEELVRSKFSGASGSLSPSNTLERNG